MAGAMTKEEYLALSEDERMRARLIGLRRHLASSEASGAFRRRGVASRPNAKEPRSPTGEGAPVDQRDFVRWLLLHELLHEILQDLDRGEDMAPQAMAALEAAHSAGITPEEGRRFLTELSERLAG